MSKTLLLRPELTFEYAVEQLSGIPIKYIDFQEIDREVVGYHHTREWGGFFQPDQVSEYEERLPVYEVTVRTEDNRAMKFKVSPEEYGSEYKSVSGNYFSGVHTIRTRKPNIRRIAPQIADRLRGVYKKKSPELLDYLENHQTPTPA